MCPGTNWGMFNDLGVYGVPKAVKERKRYWDIQTLKLRQLNGSLLELLIFLFAQEQDKKLF